MPISKEKAQRMICSVEDILSYDDERFVRFAYVALLRRLPDGDGLTFYLGSLRKGTSKLEILDQIRLSPEGKEKAAELIGLDDALRRPRSMKRQFLEMVRRTRGKASKLGGWATSRATRGTMSTPANRLPANLDATWYLEQYPDVVSSGLDPYEHYLYLGRYEARYPRFDSDWYLTEYSDVRGSSLGAREHYDKFGKAEGRFPCFDAEWYLREYPDVSAAGLDPQSHYRDFGKAEGRFPACGVQNARNNYQKWLAVFYASSPGMVAEMCSQAERFARKPLISIVMPVFDVNPAWLIDAVESVRRQIYTNWELCIADDLSSKDSIRSLLARLAEEDARIKVVFRKERGHISAASNSAIELATGEWIAFLDHDDRLSTHALFWVVHTINNSPDAQMIYSDEDKSDELDKRTEPYFKCDWNPDLICSHNMFCHLGVYRSTLVAAVGGLRVGFEGSQDHDLTLRCSERIDPSEIHHIPRVLYHWRIHASSTASETAAKPYAAMAGVKAINEHLGRRGIDARAEATQHGYRVRYALPKNVPLVSLIIPTRNGVRWLKPCVESILLKTTYRKFEILIIDNGSDDIETLDYLHTLQSKNDIRVLRDNRPFNYSALNNAAVAAADGDLIGLINNDIEVIEADWLSEMVSHALRPEVGAVGARLWFPNDTLQHGGVILGIYGVAGHAHKHLPKPQTGYVGRASLIQSLSAVTAACLVVRKSIYQAVGGLDEVNLPVIFNDVDLCLRIRQAGYRNIWTPYAELYHHESASRGIDSTPAERARFESEVAFMKSRWGDALLQDPAYSPNLTLDSEDFSFACPPRVDLCPDIRI
jgi:glycosyltransferase involved in cell wall biosynthesis